METHYIFTDEEGTMKLTKCCWKKGKRRRRKENIMGRVNLVKYPAQVYGIYHSEIPRDY
jgi:hypothetical protein